MPLISPEFLSSHFLLVVISQSGSMKRFSHNSGLQVTKKAPFLNIADQVFFMKIVNFIRQSGWVWCGCVRAVLTLH